MRVVFSTTQPQTYVRRLVNTMAASRIFAISDLHVDYKQNLQFVSGWSGVKFQNDILLVAGDVTDQMTLLQATLKSFKTKFKKVFYVPGNHELWIRGKDSSQDSVAKFYDILNMCDKIQVSYQPSKVQLTPEEAVWIVPLFSWYAKPQDDPEDSLYVTPPPSYHEDVNKMEDMWMDNHLCKWPVLPADTSLSRYFTDMNMALVRRTYDAPVISFSHFLPRRDLIRPEESDVEAVNLERKALGLGAVDPKGQGGAIGFNFTRYAGCHSLEGQIRQLKSVVHVYGHQHRNRDRTVDGVTYISHCLGNPREQKEGWTYGMQRWKGPRQVWPREEQ